MLSVVIRLGTEGGSGMDATQATMLAAVATSVSAVVSAWQAWEIRRTTAATEKSLSLITVALNDAP
jgi:hypothetical protein